MGERPARPAVATSRWSDAFRAGGYEPDIANRFIAKLKEKIEQGRGLTLAAARN